MADAGLSGLLGRLEVDATPAPEFAEALHDVLAPIAVRQRRRRHSGLARVVDRLALMTAPWTTPARTRLVWGVILMALVVAAILGAILVAGHRAPIGPSSFLYDGTVIRATNDGLAPRSTFAGTVDALSPDGRWAAQLLRDDRNETVHIAISPLELGSSGATPRPAGMVGADQVTFVDAVGSELPAWSVTDRLAWAFGGDVTNGEPAPGVALLDWPDEHPRTWLVPDQSPVGEIAWSPDGRTLAVATWRGACGASVASRLSLLEPASMTVREVRLGPDMRAYNLLWSPDGRTLALTHGDDGMCGAANTGTLTTIDVATGSVRPLGLVGAGDPLAWAPDSSAILVPVAPETDPADVRLVLARPDGAIVRSIDVPESSNNYEFGGAAISHDGATLAYITLTPGLAVAAPSPGSSGSAGDPMLDGPYGGLDSLYVVSLDEGIPRRIADGVWGPRPPAWSPDDRWIIVARTRIGTFREHSSIASDRHLWLVNPDGGSLQQIEFGPRPDAAATGGSGVESAVPR